MKKILGMLAGGVLAINVSACGLEEAVQDFADKVKAAAEQADVEAAFNQAITGVTFASLDAALDAITEVTKAPPIALMSYQPLIDVDTVTTDSKGNKATVVGKITVTEGEEETTVEVELDATWSGKVMLADGSETDAVIESKVTGSVTVIPGEDGKITLTFQNAGTITIKGKSYDFDVTVSWDSNTKSLAIAGKVNGVDKPETKVTIDLQPPATNDKDDEDKATFHGSCYLTNEVCIEYTGANYSDWDSFSCEDPEMTKSTTSCEERGLDVSGICIVGENTADEATHYDVNSNQDQCEEYLGGKWVAFEEVDEIN